MPRQADHDAIGALIESIHQSYHNKDSTAAMAAYASDAMIFDLAPPLVSAMGTDAAKLQAWFDGWEGPVNRLTRDLAISVEVDLAFCHALFRTSATTKRGEQAVFWTRVTLCLRRMGGSWRIVHEHESVPFYMDGSFRAAVDLEP
ncbi:nuclear transport factor 2 family protein [Rhizobiaceae sp. 2RAB30]